MTWYSGGYSGDRIRIRHFRDNHEKPFPLWEFRQAVCEPVHREGLWERLEIGNLSPEFRVVRAYPKSNVVAVDGAAAMLQVARARLGDQSTRVSFLVGTFAEVARQVSGIAPVDAVLSAYALHHLSASEKLDTLRQCLEVLKPRGWFLNGDLVVAESLEVEQRIQQIRLNGVVRRARQGDNRFVNVETTRRFLDELEASEGDQPLTLKEDLRLLHQAGYDTVSVFWKEYREVVYGGRKPG